MNDRNPTPADPSAERDSAEFDRIERMAEEIISAYSETDPLHAVMALRLAAQRIYDTRCRDRQPQAR